jgi:hypothetical protein
VSSLGADFCHRSPASDRRKLFVLFWIFGIPSFQKILAKTCNDVLAALFDAARTGGFYCRSFVSLLPLSRLSTAPSLPPPPLRDVIDTTVQRADTRGEGEREPSIREVVAIITLASIRLPCYIRLQPIFSTRQLPVDLFT